jgi:uncharacterized damage-inducible protein DinB
MRHEEGGADHGRRNHHERGKQLEEENGNLWYISSTLRTETPMTYDDLRLLLDYHYWARDRVYSALEPLTAGQFTRDLGNSFGSIRDTVAHLYGADWVWRSRWDGESPAALPDPAGFPDLTSIRAAWAAEEARVRAVLTRLGPDGVLRPLPYERNGVRQQQPFAHMLQHLVNHGSYHRGQVTTMLRQVGAAPPQAMDLIAFYRERADVPA